MCASRLVIAVLTGTCLLVSPLCATAAPLRQEAAGYRQQGFEAQQRGEKEAALTWYQKAIALDPTYPTPHNDLGIVYEEAGRLDEAERAYLQALALDASYVDAHANLAMLYERKGEQEKAIYHWMKRYQLGDPADEWTARAETRLVALGVLKAPSLKGTDYTRRKLLDQAFREHAQSLEEFRDLTDAHGDWP